MIGINTSALMMLLRVYAMHSSKRGIVASVAVVFTIELGTNAWLLANGIRVCLRLHLAPQWMIY